MGEPLGGLDPGPRSSSACWRLAAIIVSPAQAVIVSFVVLSAPDVFRPTGLFVPTPKCPRRSPLGRGRALPAAGPRSRCWSGSCWWQPLLLRRSGGDSSRSHGRSGGSGDLVRHPDQLHRHGLVRALGVRFGLGVARGRAAPPHRWSPPRAVGGAALRPVAARRHRCAVRGVLTRASARHHFAISTLVFSRRSSA